MYFFLSCCTEKNGVDRSFIWQTIKPAHLTLLFCFINTCVGYHFISIQTGLNRIICSWTEIRHPGFTFTYGRLQRNATLCAGSNLQSFQTNANLLTASLRMPEATNASSRFCVCRSLPCRLSVYPFALKAHTAPRANMEASFPQSRPATGTELETMRLAFRAKPSAAVRYWD